MTEERAARVAAIKRDLRRLRKVSNAIEAAMRAKEAHEKRLCHLVSLPQTEETKREMARIGKFLATLQLENRIKEASDLEERYMGLINRLDDTDRTIIISAYINGVPYWQVGRDIGYSREGIKTRVKSIMEKLAAL